ncbi:MAG: DUF5666 domain-containing protein [Verrucomicrobium sp.]|nr:DUF5666 domain-containing protein [Verrucomicrobium sp.]
MKTSLPTIFGTTLVAVGLTLWSASSVHSQTLPAATPAPQASASSSSTTTFNGTITTVKPDKLVISGDQGAMPTSYIYTPSTEYVDESGAALTLGVLKSGTPVTVQYLEEGRRMIAQKITVRRALPASPPNATAASPVQESFNRAADTVPAAGVISKVNADALVIQSDPASGPSTYAFTKSTKIVDEAGSTVGLNKLKAGSPVVIDFSERDGRLVAQRVIVKQN